MFRPIAAAAAALAFSTAASATEITDFTLENGLDVVVLEDHRAPVVVHMVWYRVGSADEPRGKSGIAHYLEHLMFKGTDSTGPGQFSDVVAANGGNDNAFTSWDYTGYFQRVASDRLDLMMQLEADRMQNLNIAAEFVDSERAVVLEERNQRIENDPGAIFNEQRRAAQYIHHPYGIPIIGWQHEIEELTVEDAVSFYEDHYAPNNAILIVAGDVEPEEVRALAEKHYGPIPANPDIQERDRVDEPPQLSERRMIYEDPRVAQPYVTRTYLAPERDAGDQREAAALTLLASVLGGSQTTSVLAQKLQLEQKVSIYSAASYRGVSLDDTTFTLFTVPPPGVSLEEAETALDAVVAEFLEEGVDADQLDRIKAQIRAARIYDADSVQRLANRYGSALTSGLTLADVDAWPDILESITGDEIIAAAKKVFDRRTAVTGWVRNVEAADGEISQ